MYFVFQVMPGQQQYNYPYNGGQYVPNAPNPRLQAGGMHMNMPNTMGMGPGGMGHAQMGQGQPGGPMKTNMNMSMYANRRSAPYPSHQQYITSKRSQVCNDCSYLIITRSLYSIDKTLREQIDNH